VLVRKGKFVDLIGQVQPSDRAPSVESEVRSVFDSASRRAARKSLISRKRIGNLT
jgi:hypothetical protein